MPRGGLPTYSLQTHTSREGDPCYNRSTVSLPENGQDHVFQLVLPPERSPYPRWLQLLGLDPLASLKGKQASSMITETRQKTPCCRDFSEAFISLLMLGLQEATAHQAALHCRNVTPLNHDNPHIVGVCSVFSTYITQTYITGTFTC